LLRKLSIFTINAAAAKMVDFADQASCNGFPWMDSLNQVT
jgi:hypothetical protein